MEPVDADASCSMWLWESDPDQSTLAVGCTAAFGLSAETGVGWRRRRVPGAAAAATVSDIDRKGRVARCRPESRGRGQLVLPVTRKGRRIQQSLIQQYRIRLLSGSRLGGGSCQYTHGYRHSCTAAGLGVDRGNMHAAACACSFVCMRMPHVHARAVPEYAPVGPDHMRFNYCMHPSGQSSNACQTGDGRCRAWREGGSSIENQIGTRVLHACCSSYRLRAACRAAPPRPRPPPRRDRRDRLPCRDRRHAAAPT